MHPSLMLLAVSFFAVMHMTLTLVVAFEKRKKLTYGDFIEFCRATVGFAAVVSLVVFLFVCIYQDIHKETWPLDERWVTVAAWQFFVWFCTFFIFPIIVEKE
jgi:hypothetical protein